ncbi:MAG: helix-turn-helix transcriptional regulator [Cyanobium sp. 49614_E6]|nr:helix-turn-helix transcriptional regulator [Cyanobium sp. 49614_E6]
MDTAQDVGELQAARLAEIVRYAQRVLGGSGAKASQRDLAAALGIAPTMVGRYLTNTDFRNLRAVTIERLAAVTQLEPGALFVWIRDGREAAIAYQQLMQQEPVVFAPVDLARRLVSLLEESDAESAVHSVQREPEPDYRALQHDINDQRAVAPAMFDRLAAMLGAEQVLERIENAAPLEEGDWLKLQQLLDLPALQLQQRYGFARAVSRTQPLPV